MLENFRLQLASAHAIPQLSLLGIISGISVGLVMIMFQLLIESSQDLFLTGHHENYESLSPVWRFILPISGALLIAAIMHQLPQSNRHVGVVHVIERLSYHQGIMPYKNAVLQFFGASISIISGHSVGREGPGVHLGAASSSLLGQWLQLPYNSMRTLVACGVAGAIAASFNTPLAGVIFAMEVVMMEYTIVSFLPVIIAAVSATVTMHLHLGNTHFFVVADLTPGTLTELALVIFLGLIVGGLAAAYINIQKFSTTLLANHSHWLRLTTAGLFTGCCAIFVPEIMGIGYDTINSSLAGNLTITALLIIVAAKLLATAVGIGLGLPGGLIGPTLIIGATVGSAFGLLVGLVFPESTVSPSYYTMLGMGAMMGATLQAPLAALIALLELTSNANIILPGMLAIITANLTSSQIFSQPSVFHMMLRQLGINYLESPLRQSLRRIGVTQTMERSFVIHDHIIKRQQTENLLSTNPRWIIIYKNHQPIQLIPAIDLVMYMKEYADAVIDLTQIPAIRLQLTSAHLRDSMLEAHEKLEQNNAEAVYIVRTNAPAIEKIYGVLTKDDINKTYQL